MRMQNTIISSDAARQDQLSTRSNLFLTSADRCCMSSDRSFQPAESGSATPRTLYDKVWDAHVVKTYDDGNCLLYIDRHLVQEVSSPQAFAGLVAANRPLRRPSAHIAVADHAVPTVGRDRPLPEGLASRQVSRLAQ